MHHLISEFIQHVLSVLKQRVQCDIFCSKVNKILVLIFIQSDHCKACLIFLHNQSGKVIENAA